jgi:hypothetical protein
MAASAARLLANRRNALKSTGPKTDDGKSRSRRNSLKHGLTGNGDVMPPEAVPEVLRRFETLKSELKPSGEAGSILLRRFAYLSVRLEKCEEFDTSATASRVRHAVEVFDDNRLTEVEWMVSQLPCDPMTMARRLQNSVEGIDWLIGHWGSLRVDLMKADDVSWTLNHWSRFNQLLGEPGGNFRVSRSHALSQALSGYFVFLDKEDGEGLDDNDRIAWARNELARLIDVEVARLQRVKLALNPALIDQDRKEAPSRALFDPSPERNLARKYEAATERAMYKALDQFHEVELAALEAEPIAASSILEEPYERVGSFFPASDPGLDPVPEPAGSLPQSPHLRKPTVSTVAISIGKPAKSEIPATEKHGKNTERRKEVVLS